MNYELREYQEKAVQSAIDFINAKKDNKKGVIVAPTGSGKSLIIAGIVNRIDSPVLVLQHSKELLEQNYEKYTSYGNKASIFSASLSSKETGHVTFATIGSIKSLGDTFKRLGVKVIIIDECHLGGGSGGMLSGFLKRIGKVKIIGLTATPIVLMNTMDNGPVLKMLNRTRKSFYNHILHITQIKEIVDAGFWTPLVYEQVSIKQDKLEYNKSRSEFSEESQQEVYKENNIEAKIVAKVEELRCSGSPILVFVPSVAGAIDLSAKIPGSEAVWGNMDGRKRDRVINEFKSREIQIVINVNVLAIGFDFPALRYIIDATPTASFGRYYQKLGRACRPHPDKPQALLVDMSGNYLRFGELYDLTFEDYPGIGWGMFLGNQLLTGVSLDNSTPVFKVPYDGNKDDTVFNFGQYKGKPVSSAPLQYLKWIMNEFTFTSKNQHIKASIEKQLNIN